jgi:hypothetical protein
MILTKQLIDACKTPSGSYTTETVIHFGLKFPLIKGWIPRLVGHEITEENYKLAFDGRLKPKNKKNAEQTEIKL